MFMFPDDLGYGIPLSERVEQIKTKFRQETCDQRCKKEFMWKATLRHHIKAAHTGITRDSPKQTSKCKDKLKVHTDSSVHNGVTQSSCDICKKTFARKSQLQIHIKTAHNGVKSAPKIGKSNLKKSIDAACNGNADKRDVRAKQFKSKDTRLNWGSIAVSSRMADARRAPARCLFCSNEAMPFIRFTDDKAAAIKGAKCDELGFCARRNSAFAGSDAWRHRKLLLRGTSKCACTTDGLLGHKVGVRRRHASECGRVRAGRVRPISLMGLCAEMSWDFPTKTCWTSSLSLGESTDRRASQSRVHTGGGRGRSRPYNSEVVTVSKQRSTDARARDILRGKGRNAKTMLQVQATGSFRSRLPVSPSRPTEASVLQLLQERRSRICTLLEARASGKFKLQAESRDGCGSDSSEIRRRIHHKAIVAITAAGQNDPPIISIRCPELKNAIVTFLVDTGSDLNLLKISRVSENALIDTQKLYTLYGISDGIVATQGRTNITLGGAKCLVNIVDDNFPISFDGILGMEFLREQQAVLSFKENELVISNADIAKIPFINYDTLFLPARTKTLVAVKLQPNSASNGYVPRIDAGPGIFAGECLVTNASNEAKLFFINATVEDVELTMAPVALVAYDTVDKKAVRIARPVSGEANSASPAERIDKIMQSLALEGLNSEEIKSVREIVSKFPFQFHLPLDKLSLTGSGGPSHCHIRRHTDQHKAVSPPPTPTRRNAKKHVQELLDNDIVEESESPYNSPYTLHCGSCRKSRPRRNKEMALAPRPVWRDGERATPRLRLRMIHKPGRKNANADALSRNPVTSSAPYSNDDVEHEIGRVFFILRPATPESDSERDYALHRQNNGLQGMQLAIEAPILDQNAPIEADDATSENSTEEASSDPPASESRPRENNKDATGDSASDESDAEDEATFTRSHPKRARLLVAKSVQQSSAQGTPNGRANDACVALARPAGHVPIRAYTCNRLERRASSDGRKDLGPSARRARLTCSRIPAANTQLPKNLRHASPLLLIMAAAPVVVIDLADEDITELIDLTGEREVIDITGEGPQRGNNLPSDDVGDDVAHDDVIYMDAASCDRCSSVSVRGSIYDPEPGTNNNSVGDGDVDNDRNSNNDNSGNSSVGSRSDDEAMDVDIMGNEESSEAGGSVADSGRGESMDAEDDVQAAAFPELPLARNNVHQNAEAPASPDPAVNRGFAVDRLPVQADVNAWLRRIELQQPAPIEMPEQVMEWRVGRNHHLDRMVLLRQPNPRFLEGLRPRAALGVRPADGRVERHMLLRLYPPLPGAARGHHPQDGPKRRLTRAVRHLPRMPSRHVARGRRPALRHVHPGHRLEPRRHPLQEDLGEQPARYTTLRRRKKGEEAQLAFKRADARRRFNSNFISCAANKGSFRTRIPQSLVAAASYTGEYPGAELRRSSAGNPLCPLFSRPRVRVSTWADVLLTLAASKIADREESRFRVARHTNRRLTSQAPLCHFERAEHVQRRVTARVLYLGVGVTSPPA
ncbi:unnamed protein product [Trichogramma brassicae]|uniref:C2H2-type domain-containing protein n=1 Tax=Trichogramma brassicae TaxID=86971 RepID=A0A6H5J5L4_9HYME|nr:unnamed protein product [Trichogramma brassicae]